MAPHWRFPWVRGNHDIVIVIGTAGDYRRIADVEPIGVAGVC